jgi:hypothetical protein
MINRTMMHHPMHLLTRHVSLIGQRHSRFGWGGGLRWQF